ncbi:MAG: right-handed parallel beta-helix repeat-containing protein [Phycisphaerales bacterium]
MLKLSLPIICIFTLLIVSSTQSAETISGPYCGQEPPGLVPKIFAPGFISLPNRYESFITFTPDGNECYFTQHHAEWAPYWIMMSVCRNGTWTTPQRAPFTNNSSVCTSISSDGTKLFFTLNSSVYQCLRTAEGGWSSPVRVNSPVSSASYEFSCHFSEKNNMFVCSWRPGGLGGCDGWVIPYVNGQWQQAQNLRTLNSHVGDCCFAPGPNEDYLIFQSRRPPTGGGGGFFGTDLHISFATDEGGWTAPRNLGSIINSSATDLGPWISYDGRYLFFSSDRQGPHDIYWVSTDAFLPDPNGPIQNLTSNQRFNSIQCAINYADEGNTIVINPGVYNESIVLTSKTVVLQSVDPNNPSSIGSTIIQGSTDSPVVTLQGNPTACEIAGLTIRAGSIGIKGTGTNTTIRNCRIMDNTTHGLELSQGSSPNLQHCLITSNGQTGITMLDGPGRNPCQPNIENCIIVGNSQADIVGGEPVITDSVVPQ